MGLAAISLTALFVPESKAPQPRRLDPVGQLLVIVMLGSLDLRDHRGPGAGWRSPGDLGFFGARGGRARGLLAYEPRRASP